MYVKRNYGFWMTFNWSKWPFIFGTIFGFTLLFVSFTMQGQDRNPEFDKTLANIDSIVTHIENTAANYSEGIAEGTLVYNSIFRKNGGWNANYIYEDPDDNPPRRITYQSSDNRSYEDIRFYFHNQTLIYAKLKINFHRGKNKGRTLEKEYYFISSEEIVSPKSPLKKYLPQYIIATEGFVRAMIYQ